MVAANGGSMCTCLLRYAVLGFLAFSVMYSTVFFLSSEDLRKNAAGLIQRGSSPFSGFSIDSQSPTFEVKSIHYSPQKMIIEKPLPGKKKKLKNSNHLELSRTLDRNV